MARRGEHAAEEEIGGSGIRGAGAFARAAPVYWLSVYPQVCAELAWQRRRAEAIPDPRLRRTALRVLASKRSNVDGAAAFAAFAPAARRAAVIRAQVAFQSVYDYLDALTEQPHPDPIANSRRLHGALIAAVAPRAAAAEAEARLRAEPAATVTATASVAAAVDAATAEDAAAAEDATAEDGADGRGAPAEDDGGYLQGTVQRCRAALRELPSYEAVRSSASRLASHIVGYQTYNVGGGAVPRAALADWARAHTPEGSGIHWWEAAASAGSSLGLFALIAMAARPEVTAAQATAVEEAYFPWIGALHSLLDSLIDRAEDEASGQHPLIEHYGRPDQIAAGLRSLARESIRRAAALPDGPSHAAILASMAALYLAEREAADPQARRARAEVLQALGGLTAPAMAVMRMRMLLRADSPRRDPVQ